MADQAWKDIIELEWVDARDTLLRWVGYEVRNASRSIDFLIYTIAMAERCPAAKVTCKMRDTGVPGTFVPSLISIRTVDPDGFRQQMHYWLRRIDDRNDDSMVCSPSFDLPFRRRREDDAIDWLNSMIFGTYQALIAATRPSAKAVAEYVALMEIRLRVRFCEEWTYEVCDELWDSRYRLDDSYNIWAVGAIISGFERHISWRRYLASLPTEAERPND